ncbi:hypothetical protein GOP47_0010188 [Adiantum capillus-veneris]|uniref:Uncharacterized protein n=1 Tax=Adiantum capillus-veneris TaxID=13818 RepID=A0A9D4ZHJ1_ADICA|nr:hypothetical protein GOP47_0010188 [Adiantum capillus-veneris]
MFLFLLTCLVVEKIQSSKWHSISSRIKLSALEVQSFIFFLHGLETCHVFSGRIKVLLRSKWLPYERIQGPSGLRERVSVPMLGHFVELQQRRLYVSRCPVGPDNKDFFEKKNGDDYNESQRTMELTLGSTISLTKKIAIRGLKIIISVMLMLSLALVGTPSILSSRLGRRSVLGLVNKFIPGHVDVQSFTLGWTKPIRAGGISLKGIDEKVVLSILKLETRASLWSLVRGKSGLGDCCIERLRVDLQEDEQSGNLKLALAVIPVSKLSSSSHRAKASMQAATKRIPSVDITLAAAVKATGGGLKVIDGKLTVRDDIAATLGQRVFIDVLLGSYALEDDDNLRQAYEMHSGLMPVKAGMWSEGTQAEAMGFIHLKKQLVKLMQPLKVEMDLSPAVAQLYLARINPLLKEVVGPAVQDEDMPDVVLNISPQDLMLPADVFMVNLEPMKAVLARGPLAGGILSLLSSGKEDVAKGKKEVGVQTSQIKSQVSIDGSVECSRIDFLIAGKVAVATWGVMNWKDETLKMILAVPSATISNLFGLNLSEGYYLKIPVGGTLEQPHVDWRAAAVGVAQLSLRQRGGKFFKNLISLLDSEETVPEPIDVIPWLSKS